LAGWWLSHPSEKYESQLGLLFPIYGKKKVPNHQPVGDARSYSPKPTQILHETYENPKQLWHLMANCWGYHTKRQIYRIIQICCVNIKYGL
jgi:hypothetical protein